MYPDSWVTAIAGFILPGDADVTTGRNEGVSGAWQSMLGASYWPDRYSRRHLKSMLVFNP